MLNRTAAQGLIDLLAAIALLGCVVGVVRRGVLAPLEMRVLWAFGGLLVFFCCRGGAELLGQRALYLACALTVCPLIVLGLTLTEGLLRRHAPRWIKALVVLGAITLFVALLASGARPPASAWGLGGGVIAALLAFSLLLALRERASLSPQENAHITALLAAGAALTLLSLTDFLPAAPVGASGAGAALLAFCTRRRVTSAAAAVHAGVDLLLALLLTSAVAPALAWLLGGAPSLAETTRLGIVIFTLLVAFGTTMGALDERLGGEALALRRALAVADTASLDRFLLSLADQPFLRGLRVAEGTLLADYDAASLVETLTRQPLWRRHALLALAGPTRGQEELADLMTRTDATHACLLSRDPVRVALLTLPEAAADEAADADIALLGRLGAIAAEGRP